MQITEDMPIYEVYDDSIKMFQVLSKINNGFHINLGMIDLVMCDTVDKLIEKITLESKNVVNIVGEEQLSLIQQSYWIGREQEFYGASNSTHLYLEVHHNLDLMKLEKVIRTLIKRHGALRSIIKEEKQFIFEEKIADTFCLETINIGREEKEKYFKKLRYNNQTRLRDLENWPLFDVKNICIDTCENFLLVDIEMIIVDGMSLQLILKDFWDIYSNSKFDVQEIDYLKCAKSVRETRDKRKYEIDKEYWMQRLPLIPNAPKLPECKIWDESNICSRLQRKIEKEEWAALEKMAKDSGVTVSIVLLYAYLLTLARWSEEPQFTINVTLSSRPYTVRDIEKVVGDFTTNILFDFSASDMKGTIAEQLKFIRNKLYEYCDHSSYEGVEIIRDMIKTGKISQEKPLPIVFTSMLFGNLPNLSEMDVVYSQSQTSQVSLDNQTYKLEDGGLIVWDFIKKIYPETMVEEMFSYYCMVIEQLSKNDGELKCSPAFEKKIKLYNSTEKEIDFFNLGKRLDNIFYKFADKIAITDFEGGITYRELERNIKSTMHDLKKNGINQIEYAIRKEVSRHDALRTIFYKNGRQKILNNVPDYSVIVTKCQNDEEKEIELQKQRKILSHKVYDHEKWPLFTFQMIESPNSRILMVSLDLMVCDGDSMQILFTEIADTLEGKSDAEKIEYSYAEYIQNISNQKNSESYEEDKAYWLNKIDSLSSYPQIPMKMKLADCRDYNIVRKSAIIDSVLWGNFKETARRHKVSPSALLCTLYGRIMAKWGNQSEVLLNLTVFQRQQKNTEKIIGDFTKLLPLNLVFAKEDIWKSAERVQEQIMKELDHLSFDGTEIMRELAKRRGVFGKALLPVVFTCVLFDCPENYFERLGSIKYAVSQTPQVFLDNQITEMGGRLHISWDVVDELFEACIIDEIFLEFVEDIKRISENNKANSTNDFVTKVWGNILTKEIITKSVVPDLLKNIDLKQIKILDYAQELCPPDVKGQVYVSESEIMNDRNKTYYKILEHPLYGRMADTGIIGVLTHDGYMEFVVPNCETSVETPDKKEDTHEEEIEKPIVKEIMKIWKEVFEIEDISIQDDFYTLGGDSIILMRLVDEMCKTLGCDVTVDDILQSENISDLANRV